MLEGLTQAEHVIMDTGYDADDLREFIDKELGAVAHIRCNPTRSAKHLIDWQLYKERHLVDWVEDESIWL